MESTEIGDLTLTPEGTDRLRLTIAEQQDTTTLTVQGVNVLMGALLAWLHEQQVVECRSRRECAPTPATPAAGRH